ncbi:MAG: DUF58 domain-containing protein, partial [Planctomycetia bacterium]
SFIQRVNLLVLIFTLLLAPAILGAWTGRRSLLGLTVRRRLPPEVYAGRPIVVEIEIGCPKRKLPAVGLLVEDVLGPPLSHVHPRSAAPNLAPGEVVVVSYRTVVHRRGRIPFTAVRLLTRFPFGFAESRLDLPAPGELVVFPKIGVVDRRRLRDAQQLQTGPTHRQWSGVSQDEFHGLRPYRVGDSPRSVHWRTTARRNELMVKEYDPESAAATVIMLELATPAAATPEEVAVARAAVENAVSFVATLCVDECRRSATGTLATAVVGDQTTLAAGPPSRRLLDQIMYGLATAEGDPDADLAAEMEKVVAGFPVGAAVWIIALRPVGPIVDALTTALGRRLGRSPVFALNAAAGDLAAFFSMPADPIPLAADAVAANDDAVAPTEGRPDAVREVEQSA